MESIWPARIRFPDELERWYQELAKGLTDLDQAAYVYPIGQTHVTIMTLMSFKDQPASNGTDD